jgi:Domain of unknown function (DUF6471)
MVAALSTRKHSYMKGDEVCEGQSLMAMMPKEREWANRARRYVKAELKRAEVSYAELARRLKDHGLEETEASITAKLNRGTFAATFFLATMKAIGRENLNLGEL